MHMKQFALFPRPAVALLTMGLWNCGGDLTLPSSSAAGLAVTVVGGNGQTGSVGDTLPDPVVVVVRTDAGDPMAGRRVAFVRSGGDPAAGFDPDTAVTNAQGQAVARWVLGTAPGAYTGEARVVAEGDTAVPTATLQAAAIAGAPDTVRPTGPTSQPGRRGEPLADPLVVMVVDRYGNAVVGAEVRWDASGGNGEFSEKKTQTAVDGTSSVTWTLGNRIGVQRATATVGSIAGSPVTFTATVLF